MKRILWLGLALALSLGVAGPAEAGMIYSWSGTGEDIYNRPDVSFPSRTPGLDGTALVFGTGSASYEKLFEVPLVPSGVLLPTEPTVVSLSTTLSNPNVPHLGVGNGTVGAGVQIASSYGGGALSLQFTDNGTTMSWGSGPVLFTGAGWANPLEVNATLTFEETLTNIDVSFESGSGDADLAAIDRTAGLSYVFFGYLGSNQYRIDSLSIEVDGAVIPEPTSLVVLGLGVVGLALRRRRKQLSN